MFLFFLMGSQSKTSAVMPSSKLSTLMRLFALRTANSSSFFRCILATEYAEPFDDDDMEDEDDPIA